MSILIEDVLHQGIETNVYIEGNTICYIGPEKKEAKTVISGQDKAIFPSLINGHTHAAMTILRGFGDDMPLQPWLETKIWPLEAKLTEEDIYWGTKLACLEMIKSGTTMFCDMYWHVHSAAKAVEEMGIRAVLSSVFLDSFDQTKASEQKKRMEILVEEFQRYSSRIRIALGPHALYTVSGETLRWIAHFAKEKELFIHFHLSETAKEVEDCIDQHGLPPVLYLDKLGFLSERLLAAHGVWLTEKEMEVLAQRKVNLIHNPTANLKLAVGKIFPYRALKERGIPCCLGTDGCASNNNLDMLEELKFAALLQKWQENDPTILPCEEAWSLATEQAAQIFRIPSGKVEVGKWADLILIDLNQPSMVPHHNIVSNLVYSAGPSVVDTVICDGRILMQDQKVPGEEEIISQAKKIANSLITR